MSKFNFDLFNKRYDKFKKNNLPTPFWDEERQVREYVCFNDDRLQVFNDLNSSLEDITLAGLYYPFVDKHVESYLKGKKWIRNVVVGHNHGHSFEEVVKAVYYSPESFKIEKKDKIYYSEQELEYLKRIQNYLLLIGVKDLGDDKISNARFRNKLQKKYSDCCIIAMHSRNINNLIKGKIDYRITKYSKYYNPDNFTPHKALIVDEKDNFRIYVEVIESIKMNKNMKTLKEQKKMLIL
nr:hypothetical protein [Bacilli bacterium]